MLPATRQDSGAFLFQQCHIAGHASFLPNISQNNVATRLRCGGMVNDRCIANFLEIVTVTEF